MHVLLCFSTFQPQAFIISGSDPDCQNIPSCVSENKLNCVLFSWLLSHIKKKKKTINAVRSSYKSPNDKAENLFFLNQYIWKDGHAFSVCSLIINRHLMVNLSDLTWRTEHFRETNQTNQLHPQLDRPPSKPHFSCPEHSNLTCFQANLCLMRCFLKNKEPCQSHQNLW